MKPSLQPRLYRPRWRASTCSYLLAAAAASLTTGCSGGTSSQGPATSGQAGAGWGGTGVGNAGGFGGGGLGGASGLAGVAGLGGAAGFGGGGLGGAGGPAGAGGTGVAGAGLAGNAPIAGTGGVAGMGIAGTGAGGGPVGTGGGLIGVPPQVIACEDVDVDCVNGTAGSHACQGVDMLAQVTVSELQGAKGANDLWGWDDPTTGKEYAVIGVNEGTTFVDISMPCKPVVLGFLKTHSRSSLWRDVKVYKDHAFIVSEAANHGMQVFDLTQLRNVSSPPATFTATAHVSSFGNVHNVAINEESGFAYPTDAGGCVRAIDIRTPAAPNDLGCIIRTGTHDAQCVNYRGPDPNFVGKEICVLAAQTKGLEIHDVTNKQNAVALGKARYPGLSYTHQGWFTDDHRYFLLGDETDDVPGRPTKTFIWDFIDLNAPKLIGTYEGTTNATDHNLYIRGKYAFAANYTVGVRILDISGIANANLTEIAYFDVYPQNDNQGYYGAWSVYPFHRSGIITVSSMQGGLFVLCPHLGGAGPGVRR